MAQIIPNEETWVGFATTVLNIHSPKHTEVDAAVDLTGLLISLTANTTGNTVPIPKLKTKFEGSINGTVSATFTADWYRDDEVDLAWETFPRETEGYLLVSRFGGTGANKKPVVGDVVEVWPLSINARTAGPLTSGTVQTLTTTGSVPEEPDEDAIVVT